MLRFSEEILLLALDEKSGRLHALPERALEFALAGALLVELSFLGRLEADADAAQLTIKGSGPAGDVVLDEVLKIFSANETKLAISRALARVALKADIFKEQLFADLVRKGILNQQQQKFLWVLRERRYPVVDDREEREVCARIREAILTPGAIPGPVDVVLIGLMDACDLGGVVFTPAELERSAGRIKQIAGQNCIVQGISRAIREIQQSILEVIAYSAM